MKKAFEQNVSRAKPRLRLGALTSPVTTETPEVPAAPEAAAPAAPVASRELVETVTTTQTPSQPPLELGAEVKARAEQARRPRMSASEALHAALAAPPEQIEILEPPAPAPEGPRFGEPDLDPDTRRERLRERLKAVRENPRPEPLPATVAEAGQLAVARISSLQAELSKLKALNLALTQDLEVTRRQSEKATEEARIRMDEARRLSAEMESRAKLLAELEGELSSLEGERDEALLALQESRQALDGAAKEREELKGEIDKRDKALADALGEEERLAAELEEAKAETSTLRRSVDALTSERDTLAKQVSSLTSEVAELLAARKALEAVHRALSTASLR